MTEIPIWKYNESGTIPKYILQEMADNSNLSFAAIGMMVVVYYSEHPSAVGELNYRAGGDISNLIMELKKRPYIPTDEMVKMIEAEEGQS